ncbi:olfactory receptor 52K1-like [Cololabis saira]|uniref:olfactory receptor 52K1-like n=1 Tax=Cololabis saira TaxID=129043 RepID=UPI002AD20B9A|nr:olfactory receptor 52K1-like [Cololabis saira]
MDKLNASHITLSGHVEINKYRYLYFFILLLVFILIILTNCTIVYLIWIHKNLHEPMYIFIAALLLNCVLYSTTIYPKLLIDFLSKQQIISYSACLFQYFLFYSLGGSEFLLLAAMAYDRYVSICKPLIYTTIMRKTTVKIILILAWFLPASHLAVQAIISGGAKICNLELKAIFCNNAIHALNCVSSRTLTIFGLLVLLIVVLLPVLFTIFTYTKIIVIAYRSCKEFRRKAAETCLPHLLVLISTFWLVTYDVIIARVESNFPKTARLILTLQIIIYHPLFNPFIYGFKMKEIYKHLKKLFRSTKV